MFTCATNFDKEELKEFAELGEVDSMFGMASDVKLDGGREFFCGLPQVSTDEVIDYVEECNSNGVGFHLVLNASGVTDEDLKDEKLLKLLDACHDEKNGVICMDEKLRQFVKEKFPKYSLIASRIVDEQDEKGLNSLFEKYDLVTLPENLNENLELIGKLPAERTVIILNSFCAVDCPKRDKHYKLNSEFRKRKLSGEDEMKLMTEFMKELGPCTASKLSQISRVHIEPEDFKKYVDLGIKHFKVLDRRDPPTAGFLKEYLREI